MNRERRKMSYKVLHPFVVLIFVLSLIFIPTGTTFAAMIQPAVSNLIVNGNFEAGNTGFTSGYTYSPGNMTLAATYDVLTNPTSSHPSAATFGDHTSGAGRMMAVNGANFAGPVVWSQSVTVTANTDYQFSAWVASWFFQAPAQLRFLINGVQVGTFTAPSTSGVWQQFVVNWNSGASTSAAIQIIDLNTENSGNDFALDDLSLVSLPCALNLAVNGNFEA